MPSPPPVEAAAGLPRNCGEGLKTDARKAGAAAVREFNYPIIALAAIVAGGLTMLALLGLVQLLAGP